LSAFGVSRELRASSYVLCSTSKMAAKKTSKVAKVVPAAPTVVQDIEAAIEIERAAATASSEEESASASTSASERGHYQDFQNLFGRAGSSRRTRHEARVERVARLRLEGRDRGAVFPPNINTSRGYTRKTSTITTTITTTTTKTFDQPLDQDYFDEDFENVTGRRPPTFVTPTKTSIPTQVTTETKTTVIRSTELTSRPQ
jgi:hypothetical protein